MSNLSKFITLCLLATLSLSGYTTNDTSKPQANINELFNITTTKTISIFSLVNLENNSLTSVNTNNSRTPTNFTYKPISFNDSTVSTILNDINITTKRYKTTKVSISTSSLFIATNNSLTVIISSLAAFAFILITPVLVYKCIRYKRKSESYSLTEETSQQNSVVQIRTYSN